MVQVAPGVDTIPAGHTERRYGPVSPSSSRRRSTPG
jgi:hypothetical protein